VEREDLMPSDSGRYVPGDFYRVCDRTGFKVRSSLMRKEWTGRIVRSDSYEPRQPQDFVRGVADVQSVPDPRPYPTDVFLGPLGTVLTASVALGATTLPVQSSIRMLTGDTVTVMMDNGEQHRTTILSVPDTVTIVLSRGLSRSAAAGNEVIDITAYSPPNLG
jgi:hypothetical protein